MCSTVLPVIYLFSGGQLDSRLLCMIRKRIVTFLRLLYSGLSSNIFHYILIWYFSVMFQFCIYIKQSHLYSFFQGMESSFVLPLNYWVHIYRDIWKEKKINGLLLIICMVIRWLSFAILILTIVLFLSFLFDLKKEKKSLF